MCTHTHTLGNQRCCWQLSKGRWTWVLLAGDKPDRYKHKEMIRLSWGEHGGADSWTKQHSLRRQWSHNDMVPRLAALPVCTHSGRYLGTMVTVWVRLRSYALRPFPSEGQWVPLVPWRWSYCSAFRWQVNQKKHNRNLWHTGLYYLYFSFMMD